jgi:hypothetical protein
VRFLEAADSPAFPNDFGAFRVLAWPAGGQIMKTRWLLCSVAVLGIFGCGKCADEGAPTEPNGGLNVSGAWIGTITHYDSACRRKSIAVSLSQEGTTVRGSFRTSCQGMLHLRGAMNGDSVVGELYRELDGLRIGQVSGTVSRTSIHVTTWRPHPREQRKPPAQEVINVIDLSR